MKEFFSRSIGFGLLLLFSSCALLLPDSPEDLGVTHIEQENSKLCGVAVLQMLTSFYSQPLAAELTQELSEVAQQEQGITGQHLKDSLTAHGFFAAIIPGSLEEEGYSSLYHHLRSQRPLIVMLGSPNKDVFHYVLVVGSFHKSRRLIILDPRIGRYVADLDWFEKHWQLANRFTIVSYPAKAKD